MNIAEFKTEFSVLLKRYAIVTCSPIDDSSKDSSSCNHQELLDAIQDTFLSVLNVKLHCFEESALKTPANNEIVIATPDAPDVLRLDYNQNARFETFKSLVNSESKFNALHTHLEEKLAVLDNDVNVDKTNNNNKDAKNANFSTTNVQREHGNFHQKLALVHIVEEAQQNAKRVASSLQRMADMLAPAESRPEPAHAVRRLSTILNHSTKKPTPLNQSIASLRSTIQRAKAVRRSLAVTTGDDVVTTPTTSRPSHVMPATITHAKINNKATATVSKLAQHSISVSSFSTHDKTKSPVKFNKNPKYAHVQSTIPKAIVAKKNKT